VQITNIYSDIVLDNNTFFINKFQFYGYFILVAALGVGNALVIQQNQRKAFTEHLKKLFIVIPLTVFLAQYGIYHYQKLKVEREGGGFWALQRSWEEMQDYVRRHTPKEAVIFVPYNMEMGGFRIGAERTIVVSYRDSGIVGFDYRAAMEWKKRIEDVGAFKFNITASPWPAVKNAVEKYHADYIVFMAPVAPGPNPLMTQLYHNQYFALYQVNG